MSLHYKHMLSSSSLCKNKEVLARNGGGKIGKEMYLICIIWKSHLWTWHPFTRFVSRLENPPVPWSYSFIRLQISLWSLLLSQYFQDSCHVVNMLQEKFNLEIIILRWPFLQSLNPSIASTILESVLNHLLLWSTSNIVTCFVSLMGDTLRPSYDESFPVDFNSLSRN